MTWSGKQHPMMRLCESTLWGELNPGGLVETICPMSYLHGCVTEVTVVNLSWLKVKELVFPLTESVSADGGAEQILGLKHIKDDVARGFLQSAKRGKNKKNTQKKSKKPAIRPTACGSACDRQEGGEGWWW